MSFRYKTILGIAAIEAVLLFVLIWSSLRLLSASNEEELIKRASTTATLFATTTKDAVLATDVAALESFVAEVLKNPGLVYARVSSTVDGVLAQGGRPEVLRRPFVPDQGVDEVADGIFDIHAEISEGGVTYGRVEIGLSVADIGNVLRNARDRAVVIAGVEMVLTGLFSLVLGTYLTRQLTSLKDASRRLAAGDLGYQIVVRGRDELAETAEAFNEMSRKLRDSLHRRRVAEEELQRLNDDLETRVNLRTKKIAAVNKQLQHQALHDALTRLPNRLLFHDRLDQAIRVARRDRLTLAVALVDLDGFKQINDTLGHHAGDLVLQQCAFRIREVLRDSDTVARLGGDEFALLLPQVADRAVVLGVLQKLLAALREPITLAGEQYRIGASIGVSVWPEDGDRPDALVRQADTAMYLAKRSRSGIAEYDPEHDAQGRERQTLLADLRRAIERDELVLHFQPKVDCNSNWVSGVSALVRWQRPGHGLVMPEDFLPIAEESGLGKAIGMHVVRLAATQCAGWQREGIDLPVAVRVSASTIQDPEFPEQVRKLMAELGTSGVPLEISVTESTILADPLQVADTVAQLDRIGINLSISDFGSGYAFLTYLNRFNVAGLRIDRSVVLGMLDNENNTAVVSATVGLAHSLGLKVVAEGVESEMLWDQLKTLGCDSATGHFLGRPVPAAELLDGLRRGRAGRVFGSVVAR